MLKPIKTNQECEQALERVYNLMQKNINNLSRDLFLINFVVILKC